MSEKLTDKDIDKIFRDSVDNMATEPSESFWINASEDTLFKSTQAHTREVYKWKAIAYTLGAILLALSAYIVYTQRQVTGVKDQVNLLEKKIGQIPDNAAVQPTTQVATVLHENKPAANAPAAISTTRETVATPHTAHQSKNIQHSQTIAHNFVTSKTSANYTAESSIAFNNKPVSAENKVASPGAVVLNEPISPSTATNTLQKATTPPAAGNVDMATLNNTAEQTTSAENKPQQTTASTNTPAAAANNTTTTDATPKSITGASKSSLQTVPAKPLTDSVTATTQQNGATATTGSKKFLSHLSASVFYEPYLADEFFENDASDNTVINNVVSSEEEVNPYQVGLRLGYDISSHLSVYTGCYFYNFKVSIQPTTIYAQQQNGQEKYYFQTSLGDVTCPYTTASTSNNGIVINGIATADYISVPALLRYNFINTGKWKIYTTAGVIANIVIYKKMNVHWQDFAWDQGNAVEGISNSQMTSYSYYVSPGISYNCFKGFSVYIEPSIQGSPILWGKNTASKNSPPYIGAGGGIIYHF